MALRFFSFTLKRPGRTTWPRYSTSLLKRWRFCALRVTPCFPSRVSTVSKWDRMDSASAKKMIRSSKLTSSFCHVTPHRIMSIASWKVAGALHRPKGRRLHSFVPQWQVNAVLGLSFSAMGICQYQPLQSNVETNWASPQESTQLSIPGNGYEPRTVRSFKCR